MKYFRDVVIPAARRSPEVAKAWEEAGRRAGVTIEDYERSFNTEAPAQPEKVDPA